MNSDKIGLGLITCDRFDFLKKSLTSILEKTKDLSADKFRLVVIDDSAEKNNNNYNFTQSDKLNLIFTSKGREGVGKAKNYALRDLLDNGCEHIFLMEDDIELIDINVFDLYINASKSTGIYHFNFGLHGNHNKDHLGYPTIRKTLNYPDFTKINFYPNVLGAFSYYHRNVLEKIGIFDEDYYNAMEHVDHTYKAWKAGFTSAFRFFADVNGSEKYLKDIVPDHKESKIRSESNFQEIFKNGLDLFIKKNGFSVVSGYGPSENTLTEEECMEELRKFWTDRVKLKLIN